MPSFLIPYKKYIGISLILIISLIIAIIAFTRQNAPPSNVPLPAVEVATNPQQQETAKLPPKKETKLTTVVIVDVKGAVKHPGVYQFQQESRVEQAIEQAGGFTKSADQKQINLAAKLQDEMVIDVLTKGEASKKSTQTGNASSVATVTGTATSEQPLVNLNTADEAALQTLSGIGPAKSQAIIAYRTENGPFQTIEDLKKISGFGEKTFERLKPAITVQ